MAAPEGESTDACGGGSCGGGSWDDGGFAAPEQAAPADATAPPAATDDGFTAFEKAPSDGPPPAAAEEDPGRRFRSPPRDDAAGSSSGDADAPAVASPSTDALDAPEPTSEGDARRRRCSRATTTPAPARDVRPLETSSFEHVAAPGARAAQRCPLGLRRAPGTRGRRRRGVPGNDGARC